MEKNTFRLVIVIAIVLSYRCCWTDRGALRECKKQGSSKCMLENDITGQFSHILWKFLVHYTCEPLKLYRKRKYPNWARLITWHPWLPVALILILILYQAVLPILWKRFKWWVVKREWKILYRKNNWYRKKC